MGSRKLVCGVGINDAGYVIMYTEKLDELRPSGKNKTRIIWKCPSYFRWKDMLVRCYSEKFHTRQGKYKNCSVCKEWLTFSNFRKWMVEQDWEGKELDKDLIVQCNTIYSPELCNFVPKMVNTFTNESNSTRGKYLIGCSWDGGKGKYLAQVRGLEGERIFLGYHDTEKSAHVAWREEKHRLSCIISNTKGLSYKVQEALMCRYLEVRYVTSR